MSKYRSRNHMLLLYPDNDDHVKAYEQIKKSYDYLSILHNKDVTEDGELKKPHWHVIVRFSQPRWSSAICKDLCIQENYIEEIKKFESAMQYLIHYNDSDKVKYNIDDVDGTFKNRLLESINKIEKSEGEKVVDLLEYITDKDDYISVTEFADFCAKNGYWAEFRRSGSIFCKILEEHNNKIFQQKKIRED